MNQEIFILLSLLLGPAGFVGMIYCYRKAYLFAGETHNAQQKIHALESEIFVLSSKNHQISSQLAEKSEEKASALELNRQAAENIDSLVRENNLASEQINQLQKTISLLQTSQKKLEESLESKDRKYDSEIDALQKKSLHKKQEIETLRKELEVTKSKLEVIKKENLDKDSFLKKLEDDLASERHKSQKTDEYNLEILAEMAVIQGELNILRDRPKYDEVMMQTKSELAKALHTSAELRDQLEYKTENISVLEEELRKTRELTASWETNMRTMAEHIIGRRNRRSENQSLTDLIADAHAAINRTKVLQDVNPIEKNQNEELEYLAKLTAQSGLYRGKTPSKDNF